MAGNIRKSGFYINNCCLWENPKVLLLMYLVYFLNIKSDFPQPQNVVSGFDSEKLRLLIIVHTASE